MDNVFTKKDPLLDVINQVVLGEKKLTDAELKKREEIAQAMERENPGMDMGKKMAIATAQAKKVAEEAELDESSYNKYSEHHKKARKAANVLDGEATYHPNGHASVYFQPNKLNTREGDALRAAKNYGGKAVGNTVHFKEEVEQIDEVGKTSLIGKMKRWKEADNKGWGQAGAALRDRNNPEASKKAVRNSNRYYNLTRGKNKTSGGFPKSTTEEVEQIDEMDKTQSQQYGHGVAEPYDYGKGKWTRVGSEKMMTKKQLVKSAMKILKNKKGVKEEVEQIDETTTHYVKNAKTGKVVSPHRSREDAKSAIVALYRGGNKNNDKYVIVPANNEGVVRTVKHALGIMSKGEPDHKTAPKWATHIGRTHEGSYHWLDKHSEVEKDNNNKYFPSAGRTKFTGHKDEQQGKGFVKKLSHVKEEAEQIDEAKEIMSKNKAKVLSKHKELIDAGYTHTHSDSTSDWPRAGHTVHHHYVSPDKKHKVTMSYDGSHEFESNPNLKIKQTKGKYKPHHHLEEQLENFWGAYLTCLDEAKDDTSQQALLLRAMAKDPSDLMKMKRAIAMGDKALTNPVMRQEILKMLDQMMNLTVTDKSLLQKTRSSFMKQKQFKAVDTTNTEEYVPEEVEELDEAKIPVHHVNQAVTKVLGPSGAARFATHLRSGTDKHTSWDKVNSALMKQGVKTKHIANVAAHLKPAQYNEEAEQIDELSKGTLGSYVKAASGGINGMAALAHMAGSVTDADQKKMYWKKAVKRGKGIATAADKLTKEETSEEEV